MNYFVDENLLIFSLIRLKTRGEKGDKPKLKLTIKTGTAGAHGHERMVSPNRLDSNFQVFAKMSYGEFSTYNVPSDSEAKGRIANDQ